MKYIEQPLPGSEWQKTMRDWNPREEMETRHAPRPCTSTPQENSLTALGGLGSRRGMVGLLGSRLVGSYRASRGGELHRQAPHGARWGTPWAGGELEFCMCRARQPNASQAAAAMERSGTKVYVFFSSQGCISLKYEVFSVCKLSLNKVH